MNRRTLLAALAAVTLMQMPAMAPAQDRTLDEVSKYLNQLRSVQGRFSQRSADGYVARGTYYLRRPGKIRFEYDGDASLVIADGINIGIFDAKSTDGAQKYPIIVTPLRFLLRDGIDLNEAGVVRKQSNDGVRTAITMQDPDRPRDGSMTLVFTNSPPALTSWVVTDATGQTTAVTLETLEHVTGLNPRLFNIEWTEMQRAP